MRLEWWGKNNIISYNAVHVLLGHFNLDILLVEKEIKSVNLKRNQPWILLGRLMLKLKLQYFGHLTHWKSPWCRERLRAEGEESVRGWDGWMASLRQWTWLWANFRRWWGTWKPGVLQSWGLKESDRTGQLNNNSQLLQHYVLLQLFYLF